MTFRSNLKKIKGNLNQDLLKLSEQLYKNCRILNPDKCHYFFLGKDAKGFATILRKGP